MRKVNKPEGLIRHRSISGKKTRILRPRVVAYVGFAFVLFLGLAFSVGTRRAFSMTILRATDVPFQIMPDDRVLNHFKNHYLNQSSANQSLTFALHAEDASKGIVLTQPLSDYAVPVGGSISPHFFVSIPRSLFGPSGEVTFRILAEDRLSGSRFSVEVKGVGPYSGGS